MQHAGRVLVALALVALVPSEAAARWTRLRSANFLFIGDAPASRIRQVAESLEQFREALTRALPGATAVSPVPTIVVVFATDRSFHPAKPLFRGGATEVGGYFLAGEDLNYIAVNGEYFEIAMRTVFHEYAHFLVGNTIGSNVPPWANEGLAEFYEGMEGLEGGKTVIVGRAPSHHVELLKSSTLIPVRDLLSIGRESQVYNEGIRRGVFYAQSWALTHYLMLGNKERATQFSSFLVSLRAGLAHDRAFSEAFGDTAALERELFEYVRQFSFPALRMQFAERIDAEAGRGVTMDDVDAEIQVADLQARIGRVDEAQKRLEAIVRRTPSPALASTVLGLIDLRAQRPTEALVRLERAADQDPRDAFVQTAFGRALVAALNEQGSTDDRTVTIRKARVALSRAVEIDANSAYAAGLLGFVELLEGADLPRAVQMLERASTLAPSREQYRLLLAQALIQQGELQRATTYLGPLLASGSSEAVRSDARRLLGEVGNRSSRAASRAGAQPAETTPITPLSSARELTRPAPPTVRLDLRPIKDGETRVLGLFSAIECPPGALVLLIDANGKLLRLGAKQFSDIDFVSYRSEPPGSVSCGPLSPPARVLATYRPTTGPARTVDGDAVAIELLPDGYTPAGPR